MTEIKKETNVSAVQVLGDSLMMAAARALNTNTFIYNLLESGNLKFNHRLLTYYEKVYKNEPYKLKIENEILSYDPYAYFFICTKESKDIILNMANDIQNEFPDLFGSEIFKDFLEKKGIVTNNPTNIIQYLDSSSPFKCWHAAAFEPGVIHMGIKTKFIDNHFTITNPDVRQFVILGAGLDSRALRLPLDPITTVWELDFAQTFEYKELILRDASKVIPPTSQCRVVRIPGDLMALDNWINKLLLTGFDRTKPTVWLMEGILMYLTPKDIGNLFNKISEFSASGSNMLIQTILTKDYELIGDSPDMVIIRSIFKNDINSTTNNPEEYLTGCGFNKDLDNFSEERLLEIFNIAKTESYSRIFLNLTIGYKP